MLQPFHGWSIAALDCAVSVLIGRFVSQFLINGRPRVAGARRADHRTIATARAARETVGQS